MHLLLVRHGQSANNILEAELGCGSGFNAARSVDPPLSPLGVKQAQLLGEHLGAQLRRCRSSITLYCSSMTRACQTVQPLAKKLMLQPIVHPDLYEIKGFFSDQGSVQGPTPADIEQNFAWYDRTMGGMRYDASQLPAEGQGSETMSEAWERVDRVAAMLRKMAADGEEERVIVIVAHNDFLVALGKQLLLPSGAAVPVTLDSATEPEEMFMDSYWPMNNTGVTHLILGCKPPAAAYQVDTYLLYWSRSDHLTEELRSGVQFKNVGFGQAAAWSRVGAGGTGLGPTFNEHEVVRIPLQPWWLRPHTTFAFGFTAAGILAALRWNYSRW
eukprot:TRINITY_DN61469_c0_g1_i1.p1 TRINITY_DN61469_c0_g1~~TRINITY_DN61469_c0_g1_i1.p1  ORF type:complete len:328 (-),score=56.47 TRINITY_DN61469_c0_g1_i1:56-1039(-)